MIFLSILINIVAIALPSFQTRISPIFFLRISSLIFLYSGALSFNAYYIHSIGSGIGIYGGLFTINQTSLLLETFLFIIGSLILISWPIINLNKTYIRHNYAMEYSLIVLFTSLGSSLLMSSADLVSMYLSIELQSFGLYILATLYRESESATSAGLKYFLLGGLSSCIILLGAGLIYTFSGLTSFESIYTLISVSDLSNTIQGISLGLILIIIGFLFKIAAAPLHNWAPDVYDDSPTIVTIWLTIMPKIAILALLLELHSQIGLIGGITSFTISSSYELIEKVSFITQTFSGNSSILGSFGEVQTVYVLKNLLLISSLLSLIIGTVVGLAQTKIKRLLAYSTISHIGFILLALAINSEQSIDSLIFYIIQYSITNLNTFLIIIALAIHSKLTYFSDIKLNDINFINEIKGQFFSNPILSLSLSVCLFSMAGIPPLMGFFSKQFVLSSAIENGYYFISLVAILVSVISASYYLKIVKVLHTSISSNNEVEISTTYLGNSSLKSVSTESVSINSENITSENGASVTNLHSFIISTLTLSIIFFILKPSLILNSTQLLSLSIFNY